MKVDGSRVVLLTDNKRSGEWFPEWSPDGRRIAYARFGLRSDNYDIWIVNRKGNHHRRLQRTNRGDEVAPTWR